MRYIAAVVTAVIVFAAVAGCGAHPSPAACKAAMRRQLQRSVSSALTGRHAAAGTEPAACDGLPAPELRKLAGQIIAGR